VNYQTVRLDRIDRGRLEEQLGRAPELDHDFGVTRRRAANCNKLVTGGPFFFSPHRGLSPSRPLRIGQPPAAAERPVELRVG